MTHFRCVAAFHRAIVTEHLGAEEWNIGGIKVGRKWILWRGPMFPSLLESVAPYILWHSLACCGLGLILSSQKVGQDKLEEPLIVFTIWAKGE